jgi:hypothetical protein
MQNWYIVCHVVFVLLSIWIILKDKRIFLLRIKKKIVKHKTSSIEKPLVVCICASIVRSQHPLGYPCEISDQVPHCICKTSNQDEKCSHLCMQLFLFPRRPNQINEKIWWKKFDEKNLMKKKQIFFFFHNSSCSLDF